MNFLLYLRLLVIPGILSACGSAPYEFTSDVVVSPITDFWLVDEQGHIHSISSTNSPLTGQLKATQSEIVFRLSKPDVQKPEHAADSSKGEKADVHANTRVATHAYRFELSTASLFQAITSKLAAQALLPGQSTKMPTLIAKGFDWNQQKYRQLADLVVDTNLVAIRDDANVTYPVPCKTKTTPSFAYLTDNATPPYVDGSAMATAVRRFYEVHVHGQLKVVEQDVVFATFSLSKPHQMSQIVPGTERVGDCKPLNQVVEQFMMDG